VPAPGRAACYCPPAAHPAAVRLAHQAAEGAVDGCCEGASMPRLHRQVARLRTLEDAIDVAGSIPRKVNCFCKTTFEVQGLLLDLCFAQ
jgi:hypothetical protein